MSSYHRCSPILQRYEGITLTWRYSAGERPGSDLLHKHHRHCWRLQSRSKFTSQFQSSMLRVNASCHSTIFHTSPECRPWSLVICFFLLNCEQTSFAQRWGDRSHCCHTTPRQGTCRNADLLHGPQHASSHGCVGGRKWLMLHVRGVGAL